MSICRWPRARRRFELSEPDLPNGRPTCLRLLLGVRLHRMFVHGVRSLIHWKQDVHLHGMPAGKAQCSGKGWQLEGKGRAGQGKATWGRELKQCLAGSSHPKYRQGDERSRGLDPFRPPGVRTGPSREGHAWAGCDSLKLCKSGTLGVSMERSRPPGGKRGEHTRRQPYRCCRLFGAR